MRKNVICTKRVVIINAVAILLAVAIAIIIKAFLPADVNVDDFDGALVRILGFPAVAVLYFTILFLHCALVMQYFGDKSNLTKLQIGFRFGIVFAALYLFGMQEVVVEASPFEEWGFAFVRYQFIIGVTDAIPALLLCMGISYKLLNRNNSGGIQLLNMMGKTKVIALVTISFLIQRAIGYETGIVASNSATFPIPTYLWTIIFGIVLGLSYVLLYPIFAKGQCKLLLSFQIVVVTVGINWILFNSFIGLIFKGAMQQMLLRTGIDIVVFYVTIIIIQKYFIEADRREDHKTSSKDLRG